MVPQLRYHQSQYETEMEPAFAGGSLSEGGEETATTQTGNMPVEWSDWGAGAAFKQKGLDLKQRIAEMSNETKSYLGSLRANDAKSAVGKIMQDLAKNKITKELANDAILKATIYFDSANAALIGQGLDPRQSGMTRQFQQTPGATQLPPQQQQIPQQQLGGNMGPQPGQPMSVGGPQQPPVVAPQTPPRAAGPPQTPPKKKEPTPYGGGKLAVIDAEEQGALNEYNANVDEQIARLEQLKKHKGKAYGTGLIGIAGRKTPQTDAYAFGVDLRSANASKVIQSIMKMKQASKNGSTGFGALSEPENQRLLDADASLDPILDEKDFDKKVDEYIALLRDQKIRATKKQEGVSDARNMPKSQKPMTLDDYLASKGK